MYCMKRMWLLAVAVAAVAVAGCGQQPVNPMTFDEAHEQVNVQLFGQVGEATQKVLAWEALKETEMLAIRGEAEGAKGELVLNAVSDVDTASVNSVVDVAIKGEESESQMSVDAKSSMQFRIVDGVLYVQLGETTVDMGEGNPIATMVEGFTTQLQNQWIEINFEELASLAGEDLGPNPFDAVAMNNAKKFMVDLSNLVAENNLFVQKGEERTVDGKQVFDVAVNVEGIQAIVEGIFDNEYAATMFAAQGLTFSDQEKADVVASIPAVVGAMDLQAYLRVDANNDVVLVIDMLGAAGEKGGLKNSFVGAHKGHFELYDESDVMVMKAESKKKGYKVVGFDGDNEVFEAMVDGMLKVKDSSVKASVSVDVAIDAESIGSPKDINVSVQYDSLTEKSSAVTVEKPAESMPFMQLIQSFGVDPTSAQSSLPPAFEVDTEVVN